MPGGSNSESWISRVANAWLERRSGRSRTPLRAMPRSATGARPGGNWNPGRNCRFSPSAHNCAMCPGSWPTGVPRGHCGIAAGRARCPRSPRRGWRRGLWTCSGLSVRACPRSPAEPLAAGAGEEGIEVDGLEHHLGEASLRHQVCHDLAGEGEELVGTVGASRGPSSCSEKPFAAKMPAWWTSTIRASGLRSWS